MGRCLRPKLSASAIYPAPVRCRKFAASAGPGQSDLLLLVARIVAAPFHGPPGRMLTNPLGDIGLRGHHALPERTVPGELKVLFLAIGRVGDGTDGQDDLNQSALPSKRCITILRSIHPAVSNFRQKPRAHNHGTPNQPRGSMAAPTGTVAPRARRIGVAVKQNGSECFAEYFAVHPGVLPHRNRDSSRKAVAKSLALTFDVSVQSFRRTEQNSLPGSLRCIAYALDARRGERIAPSSSSPPTDESFSESRKHSRLKQETLSGGTVNENTRRGRVPGEEAA